MRYRYLNSATQRHARGRSTGWLRRLAGLAAGLLVMSLATSLAPVTAQALTAGTLSLTRSSSSLVTLESSRLSSKTIVDMKVPTSLPFHAGVQFRSANNGAGYRSKVGVAADGAMRVSLSRVAGGVETPLGSYQTTGVTVKPGETIRLQGVVAGLNPVLVYVRAWKSGSATPEWQLAARDYTASRIRTEGVTRLWGYLGSTAPATGSLSFSNVMTDPASVDIVKPYPVKTWASVGTSTTVASTTTTTSTTKPSSSTTGVKAGSTLTRHDGDITVTTDGTVLANLDIHGFVTVRAKNVTISNCIVRGGKSKGYATGLITNYGNPGLVMNDVRIVPEFPSVWFDGIKGSDFTARRVHVSGNVDSVKIQGNNVTIENSLLENTTYYASDPQQGGTPTHNDNIQILKGTNLKITGNTIRGSQNFAILGAAEKGNVTLAVNGNWLDGGHCTVKLSTRNGYAETATVTNNKFGPNRAVSSCVFTAYPVVNLTQNTNTFEVTGATVKPLIVVS